MFGDIDTTELRSAIDEAQRRLRAGQADLAIHPRCGTNLAVAGILSGVAAALASQLNPRQNRFSYAMLASLGAPDGRSPHGHGNTAAFHHDRGPGRPRVGDIERRRFPFTRDTTHWVRTYST